MLASLAVFQSASAKMAEALPSQSLIAASYDSSCELLKPGPLPVSALSWHVYPLGGPDGTAASPSGEGAAALTGAKSSAAPLKTRAQTRAIFGIEPPPRVAGDGSVLNPTSAAPLIWDGRRLLASPTRVGKTLRTKPRAFTAS